MRCEGVGNDGAQCHRDAEPGQALCNFHQFVADVTAQGVAEARAERDRRSFELALAVMTLSVEVGRERAGSDWGAIVGERADDLLAAASNYEMRSALLATAVLVAQAWIAAEPIDGQMTADERLVQLSIAWLTPPSDVG